jgi:hypothetical protein
VRRAERSSVLISQPILEVNSSFTRPLPPTGSRAKRRRQHQQRTPIQKETSHPAAPCDTPTANDTAARAESVRLVDVPLSGRGRRYLAERELEQDGYAALDRLGLGFDC